MEIYIFIENYPENDFKVLYFTNIVDKYIYNPLREFYRNNSTSIYKEGINFNDMGWYIVNRRYRDY